MKDPLEHERMRIRTMTQEQLLTRLGKITKPEKLESFIVVAKEYRYDVLVKIAAKRQQEGVAPKTKVTIQPKPIKLKQPEKKSQKPPKRALIF